MLKQHKHQAENRDRGEKTELKILPAVKKVVEVPVILSPGTDCNQQNREPNEDTTSHGTGLKGSVPERSLRTGYLLQSTLSNSHNSIRSGRSGGPGLEGISNSVSSRTESIVSGLATTQSEPDNWHQFCWKSDSALLSPVEISSCGDAGPKVVPYSFNDILTCLNQVVANDWEDFLTERLHALSRAPLQGIAGAGYNLVYQEGADGDFRYSLAMSIGADGVISDVLMGEIAYQAGFGPGMKILTVNGQPFARAIVSRQSIPQKRLRRPLTSRLTILA